MKVKKTNLFIVIIVFVLITGATVVFATSTEDKHSLGLFGHVRNDVNLGRYVNHINEVSEHTAMVSIKDTNLSINHTIFTDHHVYAIIGLKGNGMEELDINGRIIYEDVDQTIYGLDGESQEIGQEDGVRYFFYAGKIAQTGKASENKQLIIAAGDNFLKYNSLRDFEGTLLEFGVDVNGDEHYLTTVVNNVFTDALTFQPDMNQYVGDFYESVTLTPYELKLAGRSKSLLSADEEEWEQPHFHITIVRKGHVNIHMKYDTRGSISDEGFPLGMSRGHNSDTGEFNHNWDFHGWELDLKEVSALIIDGERYRVKR